MSDETGTTSEVARVLAESAPCFWSIPEPEHPYGRHCLDDHPDKHPGTGYCWVRPNVQATALAEAGLLRDYAVNAHESCNRELGNALAMAEEAQIATQEPAGATQGGCGDSRVSGGLGERLRALGTGQTRTLRKRLRAMADEVERLENEAEMQRHSARSWRVQAEHAQSKVERVRALADKYAQGRGGPTARRIREALDGEVTP